MQQTFGAAAAASATAGAGATVHGEPLPFLVHFDPAGFEPRLAYSDDGLARQDRKVPRLWSALVVFVFLVMVRPPC